MDFVNKKLLTIITESDLEEHLIKDINNLGAKGYTITSVQGKGEKGIRNDLWSATSNIKLEVVCDAKICLEIIDFLNKNYIKNYAMLIFTIDIEVIK
ncbi:MAG: transcriptional regulator [bacterium]